MGAETEKQGRTEDQGERVGTKEEGWRICVPQKRTLCRRNIIYACLLCKLNFSLSQNNAEMENKEEHIPATSDEDQILEYSPLLPPEKLSPAWS